MRLEEMIQAMEGTLLQGSAKAEVQGVSIDSRTIRRGELFFAVEGPRFDGHAFLGEAASKGAAGAVVSGKTAPPVSAEFPQWPLVGVDDTTRALGRLGRAFKDRWPCVSVGVTGSAGKTGAKEILKAFLSAWYEVFASEGNLNNLYGLPLSLTRREPRHDALVCEMGISTPGEMERLVEIYTPDVMLFTCIAPAHLESFDSVEAIYREKTSVLKRMGANGTAVVNGDDAFLVRVCDELAGASAFQGRVIAYGLSQSCDVRASDVESRGFEGSSFKVSFPDGQGASLRLMLPGRANARNALGAAAAAWSLGVSAEAMAEKAVSLAPLEGRGRMLHLPGNIRVVDDSYNANPESFRAALEALKETPPSTGRGRNVLAAGDMLELGPGEHAFHEDVGALAASCEVDALFAVGERSRRMAAVARKGGVPNVREFTTAEEAGEALASFLREGDLVLVKGSRGMRMEEALAALRERLGAEERC
ncbi:MAG: UDP-N-acetylmuramoyl-tripeptide--D-alanyl-D-alanine ligase [Acidobacteriota bacterium]|nr:MAG: UDP-N-acetylmuramoyl-tripeptide--D-alanyl-D-alanine ligase [Acidobacteriota bacterium]